MTDRFDSIGPRPMRANGELGPNVFEALPGAADEITHTKASLDLTTLEGALAQSLAPVQTLVPSAWSRHAPFLLSLVWILRPRRYVEIGTHFGMSL